MDLVSNGPFTVAGVVWQPAPRTFALTFVCRATFLLAPREVTLAPQQDAPIGHESGLGDDASRALPPSDLVPFKVRADVMVVGNLFAPRRDPSRTLLARFKVGEVERAAEVFGDRVPPGFGPLAWPLRREALGRHAAMFSMARWMNDPLPSDFDPSFFNAAPREQQLDALRDDETIILENMHPEHARLKTSLPGIRPRARVERRAGSEEIGMRADTLWIDTTRGICAVTWRGRVMLDAPGESGRVVIEMSRSKPVDGSASTWETLAIDGSLSELRDAAEASRAALPFVAAHAPAYAPPPFAPPQPAYAPTFGPAPAPISPPSPAIVAPQPMLVPSLASPSLATPALTARPVSTDDVSDEPSVDDAPATPRREKVVARDIVKLVHVDPKSPARVRTDKGWRKLLADLELRFVSEEEDDVASGPIPDATKDRRRVHEVLLVGEAIAPESVKQVVEQSIRDDGGFDPKLAVLDAELELPFDEVLLLKTYAALSRPLVGGDKRMIEILELTDQLLATPELRASGGMAEGLSAKLRDAFAQGKRAVAPDYLDTHAERTLLEQRAYQRRTLFDKKWIRALARGASLSLPVYLPDDLANGLPMFRRFRARMLVELDMREDQAETSPHCARVLALGRVLPRGG